MTMSAERRRYDVSERDVDVVVLGGGPAGEVAAGKLGRAGLKVVLVESELLGGECSYWGCMPSKALLRPAEALAEARRIPGAAAAVTGELDVDAVLARRDEVIHDFDDSSQLPWLDERGVDVVRGHGRLDGERRVRVGDEVLVARRAVIVATGSGSQLPPIDGLREASIWTNREATTANDVPERLLVLGGGVVGVELAQAWASLGAHVTLVELFERLIVREEPSASEQVEAALRAAGVEVRTGAEAVAARREGGTVTLQLDGGDSVEGDELLVAVGRAPRTDDIGLETVGLEAGGPLEVDDALRAGGTDWLYAIGDVNGRALLTHMGKHQAAIAAMNILGGDARAEGPAHGPLSPRVIFTDPQVAAVGHTLESAQKAGIDAVEVDHPTASIAGGSFYGRGAEGTTRFVFDSSRDVLVGATFVGPEVAELVHAATIAIVGELSLAQLARAVPAFPTRSELWLRLLDAYAEHRERRPTVIGAA
jgi:pyruvate/2-oxoglutarate dehydrogenase complex dihydrolipoamide dehydrogenase (E3) component